MKYVSIDIETTGLDTERYQILSIGAIIEDANKKLSFNEIPKFHVAILHPEVIGSLFALNMNYKLIDYISQYQDTKDNKIKSAIEKKAGMKFLNEDQVAEAFFQFLFLNGICSMSVDDLFQSQKKKSFFSDVDVPVLTSKMTPTSINVAGKNFSSFDKKFLERLPRWKQCIRIRQRVIDPAVLFVNWKEDETVPGLGECKKRAGFVDLVSHNALEDAWDVVELLRKSY